MTNLTINDMFTVDGTVIPSGIPSPENLVTYIPSVDAPAFLTCTSGTWSFANALYANVCDWSEDWNIGEDVLAGATIDDWISTYLGIEDTDFALSLLSSGTANNFSITIAEFLQILSEMYIRSWSYTGEEGTENDPTIPLSEGGVTVNVSSSYVPSQIKPFSGSLSAVIATAMNEASESHVAPEAIPYTSSSHGSSYPISCNTGNVLRTKCKFRIYKAETGVKLYESLSYNILTGDTTYAPEVLLDTETGEISIHLIINPNATGEIDRVIDQWGFTNKASFTLDELKGCFVVFQPYEGVDLWFLCAGKFAKKYGDAFVFSNVPSTSSGLSVLAKGFAYVEASNNGVISKSGANIEYVPTINASSLYEHLHMQIEHTFAFDNYDVVQDGSATVDVVVNATCRFGAQSDSCYITSIAGSGDPEINIGDPVTKVFGNEFDIIAALYDRFDSYPDYTASRMAIVNALVGHRGSYDAYLHDQSISMANSLATRLIDEICNAIVSGTPEEDFPLTNGVDGSTAYAINVPIGDGHYLSIADIMSQEAGYEEAIKVLTRARFNTNYRATLGMLLQAFNAATTEGITQALTWINDQLTSVRSAAIEAVSGARKYAVKRALLGTYNELEATLIDIRDIYQNALNADTTVDAVIREASKSDKSVGLYETDARTLELLDSITALYFPSLEGYNEAQAIVATPRLGTVTQWFSKLGGSVMNRGAAESQIYAADTGAAIIYPPVFTGIISVPAGAKIDDLNNLHACLPLAKSLISIHSIKTNSRYVQVDVYARFTGGSELDAVRAVNECASEVASVMNDLYVNAFGHTAEFSVPTVDIDAIVDAAAGSRASGAATAVVGGAVTGAAAGAAVAGIALLATNPIGWIAAATIVLVGTVAGALAATAVATVEEAGDQSSWDTLLDADTLDPLETFSMMGEGVSCTIDGVTYTGDEAVRFISKGLAYILFSGAVAPIGPVSGEYSPVAQSWLVSYLVPKYFVTESEDVDWTPLVTTVTIALTAIYTKHYFKLPKARSAAFIPGILLGGGLALLTDAITVGSSAAISALTNFVSPLLASSTDETNDVDYDQLNYQLNQDIKGVVDFIAASSVIRNGSVDKVVFF